MLVKCPECDLQVSNKAIYCPHCGYPLKTETKISVSRSKNKRRRLPNGFGQISEIKGRNLRCRFRAMVTVGKTEEGRPISKMLTPRAYFETYNDAYAALVEYHRLEDRFFDDTKIETLYRRYEEIYLLNKKNKRVSKANFWNYWKYISVIKDLPVRDFRAYHVRKVLDESSTINPDISINTKRSIKNTLNGLMDYAVECDLTDHNYSRMFEYRYDKNEETDTTQKHINFTNEEFEKILNSINDVHNADMLIIQSYTGIRPGELCVLETKNINIEERKIVGGLKTKAGINREIPIHSKILPLVQHRYEMAVNANSKYLFFYNVASTNKIKPYSTKGYATIFSNVCERLSLNPNHRPHDCRVHFITLAKKYNVNEYAIKKIVGHAIRDITESIYTRREFSWLIEEIEKIQ